MQRLPAPSIRWWRCWEVGRGVQRLPAPPLDIGTSDTRSSNRSCSSFWQQGRGQVAWQVEGFGCCHIVIMGMDRVERAWRSEYSEAVSGKLLPFPCFVLFQGTFHARFWGVWSSWPPEPSSPVASSVPQRPQSYAYGTGGCFPAPRRSACAPRQFSLFYLATSTLAL